MDILQHLSSLLLSASMIFTSFLGHSQATNSQQPTPTIVMQNTSTSADYTASHTLSYNGYTITMNVAIPKNGGNIKGTISGDCTGNITGTYDGKDNGAVNGNADVNCQLLAIQIPGTATFTGIINKKNKSAQLQVTMKVNSFEKTQNVQVTFN